MLEGIRSRIAWSSTRTLMNPHDSFLLSSERELSKNLSKSLYLTMHHNFWLNSHWCAPLMFPHWGGAMTSVWIQPHFTTCWQNLHWHMRFLPFSFQGIQATRIIRTLSWPFYSQVFGRNEICNFPLCTFQTRGCDCCRWSCFQFTSARVIPLSALIQQVTVTSQSFAVLKVSVPLLHWYCEARKHKPIRFCGLFLAVKCQGEDLGNK